MADNFDLKKFLTENQLGPFAKARLKEDWSAKGWNDEPSDSDKDDERQNAESGDESGMERNIDETTSFGRTITNLGMLEEILDNLLRNTATNSNIPTDDKQGLLNAFNEMKELVLEIGSDVEQEEEGEEMTDYMQRRKSDY